MSNNVLSFTPIPPGLKDTNPQVHATPENDFLRLNLVDDLYAHLGFFEGAVFVAHADEIIEGHMHYVEIDGYGFLARLTECEASTVEVIPLDRETPADTYPRAKLEFVGAIVQMYPRGLKGSLWVLAAKDGLGVERPFFEAVAN